MYKVIATDLDGTLLNADHQVDPFTVATVRKLESDGLRFVIATGRHYCDVAGIRDVLLVALLGPVIGTAGATAVALVSRILMTLGDLVLAAVAAWSGRRAGVSPSERLPE